MVASWVGTIERLLGRLGEVVVISASRATGRRDDVEVIDEHVQVHLDLLRWISNLDLGKPRPGQKESASHAHASRPLLFR